MWSPLPRVMAPVAALALVAAPAATPLAAPLGIGVVATAQAQAAGATADPTPTDDRGTIGIALAEVPAQGQARQDPRAHRYIVGHLGGGETTTRRIEISNDTDSAQRIEVYAGPAAMGGGRFLPADPGATSALTSWIRIDRPVLHLPPRGSAEVAVEVSAPRDAPSREHYGVIWASHTSPAEVPGGREAGGIDLINRVGVRMYLSTGQTPPPSPGFQIIDLRPIRDAVGLAALVATVTNLGSLAVDLAGTMTLTDGPGGLSTPPIPAEPATIGPGETADVQFRLDPDTGPPPGEWQAQLELASGPVQRAAVKSVTLRQADQPSSQTFGATDPSLLTARGLLLSAVVAALGLTAAIVWDCCTDR